MTDSELKLECYKASTDGAAEKRIEDAQALYEWCRQYSVLYIPRIDFDILVRSLGMDATWRNKRQLELEWAGIVVSPVDMRPSALTVRQ